MCEVAIYTEWGWLHLAPHGAKGRHSKISALPCVAAGLLHWWSTMGSFRGWLQGLELWTPHLHHLTEAVISRDASLWGFVHLYIQFSTLRLSNKWWKYEAVMRKETPGDVTSSYFWPCVPFLRILCSLMIYRDYCTGFGLPFFCYITAIILMLITVSRLWWLGSSWFTFLI